MNNIKAKELILYILIIIVCVCFYRLIDWKAELTQKNELVDKLKKEVSISNSTLQDAYTIQAYNWLLGADSVKNTSLINYKKDKLLLHSLLKDNIFIFYFESKMCESCVEKEFHNLEKLTDIFGKEKLIIIGSGFHSEYIYNDEKYTKWKKQIYLCKSNIYSKRSLSNTPSLTLANSKGTIFAAYHATKSNNKHFELFLKFLRKKINK